MDQYDRLQKLQELKESGAIDEVEYETCKYKIMSEIHRPGYPYAKVNNGEGTSIVFMSILLIAIIILVIILIPSIADVVNNSEGGSIFTPKTERIAKMTQELLEEGWRKDGINVTVVKNMVVTKKEGNEYAGIMTIQYMGKQIQLTGTILYDGHSIQWKPDREELFYQMLF